ncbi:MAG: RraA family protein [Paracoccus sp. (in: a-proteobacteria)]|nr:RraA family protein [Paracoccus sp. (in: a-proteobacteria)]
MTLGFRILKRRRAVSGEIARAFRELPVANVSDSMARISAAGPRLRPFHRRGLTVAGPALTVKSRPGDNLLLHKAIDMAAPGDVIVVDAGGDLTNALMGEIMVAIAQKKGIAGFVLNGALRDADEIYASGIGIYAAGVTHRGPYKDGPGEINVPIAIDGMVVEPGDLILGDGDGVVCVPYDEAGAMLRAARAKQQAEKAELAAIEAGTNDRSWVDEALRARGCAGLEG